MKPFLSRSDKVGPVELARRLTAAGQPISSQAVGQWSEVPVKRAKAVSEITGIPLHELRPDLWDPPSEGDAA